MIEGATDIHLDVVVGVGLAAGLWAGAWRVRGERPRPGETFAVAGGLVTLLLVLNGPLHALSDRYLFSAHMVQHLALSLVVAPLLLAALPAFMVDTLARPVWLARALTRPVPALGLFAVVLIGWHLPGPYGLALEHHAVHIAQHLSLIAASVVAWWPVLSRSAKAPRLQPAPQILYLFAFGFPMTAVAAMITNAERLLYPFYEAAPRLIGLSALADQRLGGVIMWVPAGLVPIVVFTVVFFRWAAEES